MMAPSDDRKPRPVSQEEMSRAKSAKDDFERMKINRILLTESLRRLRAGRTLEREHGVVHPELTCIVRDVERLARLVFPGSSATAPRDVEQEATAAPVELNAGAKLLTAHVNRSSATKIGRLVGVDAAGVKRWASGAEMPCEADRQTMAAKFRIPEESWGAS
jgi:hypothetical protein